MNRAKIKVINPLPSTDPNGISLRLDKAHFIPLSPISDSPGNQVKMLLDYTIEDPSAHADDPVSAVMEVYAENHTLLKTSSLPEPILLDGSDGTIQLATTFHDPNLKNVTARALLTDGQKINPLSDPVEANIGLGEITSADTPNSQIEIFLAFLFFNCVNGDKN